MKKYLIKLLIIAIVEVSMAIVYRNHQSAWSIIVASITFIYFVGVIIKAHRKGVL